MSVSTETKSIAARVIKALNDADLNSLNTMILESRDFTKHDADKLIKDISSNPDKINPVFIKDANNIFIEDKWSWSAVRAEIKDNQITKSLYFIFHYKDSLYWLAWAGFVDETPEPALTAVFNRLKPGLELPPVTETAESLPPVNIVTINDISEMESLKSLQAGSDWKVQLATISAGDAIKELGQSSWQMLYCKATWNDSNKPPRTIPFGRFEGQHLGPIVWTLSANGFREKPLDKSSRAVPPVSVRGDGCIYAAVLPAERMKEAYLQVYSAIDGREIARQHITQSEFTNPWGKFMNYQKDKYYGILKNLAAACPAIPPFMPIHPLPVSRLLKSANERHSKQQELPGLPTWFFCANRMDCFKPRWICARNWYARSGVSNRRWCYAMTRPWYLPPKMITSITPITGLPAWRL